MVWRCWRGWGAGNAGEEPTREERDKALQALKDPINALLVAASLIVTVGFSALVVLPDWPAFQVTAPPGAVPHRHTKLAFRAFLYCVFLSLAFSLPSLLVVLNIVFWQGEWKSGIHPVYLVQSFRLAICALIGGGLSLLGAFLSAQYLILEFHGLDALPMAIVASILIFVLLLIYFLDARKYTGRVPLELYTLLSALVLIVAILVASFVGK